MRLKDKVAIVTGAAGGIGRASAILFAREDARVAVVDIKKEALAETAALIREAGGEVYLSVSDVANESEVKAVIDGTVARWGRVDILFNNAGIVLVKFLEDTTESEWDRLMAVNLKSIFFGVKQVVPHMRRQGGGVILSTASINSFGGQFKTPAYVASKGAVMLLTKSLAMDYGADNIRVNCICPGITYTPMLQEHLEASGDPKGVLEKRLESVGILAAVVPPVYSALRHHRGWEVVVKQVVDHVHGVRHPLVGDAARELPIEAKLEIGPRVEWPVRFGEEPFSPVGVLLANLLHLGTAPPTRSAIVPDDLHLADLP